MDFKVFSPIILIFRVDNLVYHNWGYNYKFILNCPIPLVSCLNPNHPCNLHSTFSYNPVVYTCRLDIENMVLAQPETTDHKCESDQFIVTGGAPVPAICGTNTGAHSKDTFCYVEALYSAYKKNYVIQYK